MRIRLSHEVRPLSATMRVGFLLILGISSLARSEADPVEHSRHPATQAKPSPTPAPEAKVQKLPHLLAVGPMEISVSPIAGPRVRRAPLLPVPKVPEPVPVPEATTAAPQPEEAKQPEPKEPSAFSPDAPPTLLPAETPEPTTPKPAPKEEPKEGVLVPSDRPEPDLNDAVIYFETPVGPRGSQISVPAIVPLTSPASAPQPESKAIYRKEKP